MTNWTAMAADPSTHTDPPRPPAPGPSGGRGSARYLRRFPPGV